jgi:hypothetical protein
MKAGEVYFWRDCFNLSEADKAIYDEKIFFNLCSFLVQMINQDKTQK